MDVSWQAGKLSGLGFCAKWKALWHGREEERLHRWDLCSTLSDTPSGYPFAAARKGRFPASEGTSELLPTCIPSSILIKAAVLSSYLMSGPSYWDLERTLSLSHLLNNHFSYHPNHTKTGSNKPRFLNAQNQQLESDLSKENDLPHKICKKTT